MMVQAFQNISVSTRQSRCDCLKVVKRFKHRTLGFITELDRGLKLIIWVSFSVILQMIFRQFFIILGFSTPYTWIPMGIVTPVS